MHSLLIVAQICKSHLSVMSDRNIYSQILRLLQYMQSIVPLLSDNRSKTVINMIMYLIKAATTHSYGTAHMSDILPLRASGLPWI